MTQKKDARGQAINRDMNQIYRFLRMTRERAAFLCIIISALSANASLLGLSDHLLQKMSERFGAASITRLRDWQQMERNLKSSGKDDLSILESVNDLVNRIPYSSDKEIWGLDDYWATPVEFVSVNAGDCEDYVIAKYFILRANGIASSKLRIVYVRALLQGRLGTHMVLAYYPSPAAEPLVLDNIRKKVLPVSKRPDLVPVYSFNDETLYRESPSGGRIINSVSMVRRWSELLDRLKREKQL